MLWWSAFIKDLGLAEILTAIAGAVTAFVACKALYIWKHQLFVEKKVKFIDELLDTANEYIELLVEILEFLRYLRIGLDAYSSSVLPNDTRANAGVITYIEKNGKVQQQRLLEYLNKIRPAVLKLNSLNLKGSVLNFQGYTECHEACVKLLNVNKQIEALVFIIGGDSLVWENPHVQKALERLKQVNPDELQSESLKQYGILLDYAKKAYKVLLG